MATSVFLVLNILVANENSIKLIFLEYLVTSFSRHEKILLVIFTTFLGQKFQGWKQIRCHKKLRLSRIKSPQS